jgi:hypothetical protein
MAKSPKAPATPDYVGAAQATAQGNLDAVKYQTEANRVNQVGPEGNITWTQGADGKWTQTTTLNPQIQAALDAQRNASIKAIGAGSSALDQFTSQGAFNAPDYNSFVGGVPQVNTGFSGFNSSAIPQTNANFQGFNASGLPQVDAQNFQFNGSQLPGVNTSFGSGYQGNAGVDTTRYQFDGSGYQPNSNFQNFSSASQANLDAPKFDQSMVGDATKAAYQSQVGVQQEDWDKANSKLDSQLRLQGLTPGTEAYDNAMRNQLKTQELTRNQAANQAVLTGSSIANQNYASQLAGFNAGNAAQNQQFGQDFSTAGFNQQAQQLGNNVQNDLYARALAGYGANLQGQQAYNAARGQEFSQGIQQYNTQQQAVHDYNSAQNQAYQQALAGYGANIQGNQAYNAAAGQAFNQSLAGYGANQQAQQLGNAALNDQYARALTDYQSGQQALMNSNNAQSQAYQQAVNNYQNQYNSARDQYLMPMNVYSSLMSGNQIQAPQIQMATNPQAGVAAGPDMLGAAQAQGDYAQGLYNAKAANQSNMMGGLMGLAGSGLMAAAVGF